MKEIIVIPDSFKGSMTSQEVADTIEKAINAESIEKIVKLPIADGGEGSVECILSSLGGKKVYINVKSPENKEIEAYYGITDSKTAIIEIAESSGITKQTSFDAKAATTFGFGQLIRDALDKGCREFLLCLGGSATTDCGFGMAAALGAEFLDAEGNCFVPVGGTLKDICEIKTDNLDKRIADSVFTVMCDVENPLYGENGAAYVYGPQKGATKEDVIVLDEGLKKASALYEGLTGKSLAQMPGAGAAGGAGYGCLAFLNATMKRGIEAMLDIVCFDEKVENAKLIVTGEGKVDEQSFMGKVLSGIIDHSKDVPVTVFCGVSNLSEKEQKEKGIDIVEIGRGIPINESMKNGKDLLFEKAKEYFKSRTFL